MGNIKIIRLLFACFLAVILLALPDHSSRADTCDYNVGYCYGSCLASPCPAQWANGNTCYYGWGSCGWHDCLWTSTCNYSCYDNAPCSPPASYCDFIMSSGGPNIYWYQGAGPTCLSSMSGWYCYHNENYCGKMLLSGPSQGQCCSTDCNASSGCFVGPYDYYCGRDCNDSCNGTKLVEYDNDCIRDSTHLSGTCQASCNCNTPSCSTPVTHCCAGACGAQCTTGSVQSCGDCGRGIQFCQSDCTWSSCDLEYPISISGQDTTPTDIFQDDSGNWWVTGYDTKSVYRYTADWHYTGESHYIGAGQPSGPDIPPQGLNFEENAVSPYLSGDAWLVAYADWSSDIYYDMRAYRDWNTWLIGSPIGAFKRIYGVIEDYRVIGVWTDNTTRVANVADNNNPTGIHILNEISQPRDVAIGPGNTYWALDDATDRVYQYNSSWNYTGTSYYLGGEDSSPQGIYWTGSFWYMVGSGTDKVYVYDSSWQPVSISDNDGCAACGSGDCIGTYQCDFGTHTCTSNCSTEGSSCGNCGTCAGGACGGEGVCSPGATQPCGNCGSQTCQADCAWGTCTEGVCSPGDTESQSCGSGDCAGNQQRTCQADCNWGGWSTCSSEGNSCGDYCGTCAGGSCEGEGECQASQSPSSECPCPADGCVGFDYYDYPDLGDCDASCNCQGCTPVITYNDHVHCGYNNAPTASINCCPNDCDPQGSCSPGSCTGYTNSNFCLGNNSTDPDGEGDIVYSAWDIYGWGANPDSDCAGNCDYTPQALTKGNYMVELRVEDVYSAFSTTSKSFTIIQDADADFQCAYMVVGPWLSCNNFGASAGTVVYFRDTSTPSEFGSTIVRRDWLFEDGTPASDIGNNSTTTYSSFTVVDGESGSITLEVEDDAGRVNKEEDYQILLKKRSPQWYEVSP